MIYIRCSKNSNIVELVHYKPFDELYGLGKTKEELLQDGFFVDYIPEPEQIKGKTAVLKANLDDKILYYEYVDKPLTPEEELKQRIELMQQALDDLLLSGGAE